MEEITPDKKVIKKVLKAGEGYEKPNDGSTVKCEPTRPFLIVDAWVAFGRSLVKSSRCLATFSSCTSMVKILS